MMYSVVGLLLCVGWTSAATQPPCMLVSCFADPCSFATCPGVPGAICRANYCGGCYAHFFDPTTDQNVTERCSPETTTTTSAPQGLVCPPPGFSGLCIEGCGSDADCQTGQLCCSNGCGRSCMDGICMLLLNLFLIEKGQTGIFM